MKLSTEVIRNLLTDRPVIFHAVLAKITGNANAGILLSQLLYWTPGPKEGTTVVKTIDEMQTMTGLNRREQEDGRRVLLKMNLLTLVPDVLSARSTHRINIEVLTELLANHPTSPLKGEVGQPTPLQPQ